MQTVLDSLNTGLHFALSSNDRVLLIGEDVLDPYGGAFKVTRGLSSSFPNQVLTAPISEAGMVGVAAGLALRGMRPVVEIMFGDFVTLAADQLINHAAKFRSMYNDQVRVPMVVRTPMGGRRGYGPTHSQTLEKLFLGVPGLRVVAPTVLSPDGSLGPGDLLANAILYTEDPLLFIENKLLYLQPVQNQSTLPDLTLERYPVSTYFSDDQNYPAYRLSVKGAPLASLTMAAYGYMAHLAQHVLLQLAYQREIFAELLVLTQLSPFEIDPILESARRTGRLLTIEEGTLSLGWSAEVIARAAENLGPRLRTARRLAARETTIPASGPLEKAVLPGVEDIFQTACLMVDNP